MHAVPGRPRTDSPGPVAQEGRGFMRWTRTRCSLPASTEAATASQDGFATQRLWLRLNHQDSGWAGSRVAAIAFRAPSCARNLGPVGTLRHGVTTVVWPGFRSSAHGPGRGTGPAPDAECVELCRACTRQQARSFKLAGIDLLQGSPSPGRRTSNVSPSLTDRCPVSGYTGHLSHTGLTVHERVLVYIVLHCLVDLLICPCLLLRPAIDCRLSLALYSGTKP
jgi:hypothetical protein